MTHELSLPAASAAPAKSKPKREKIYLPVTNGAPLRLRVERQLGYKQAKYVMRIEVASGLAHVGGHKGGFWEDSAGYEWYGGI